MADDSKFCVVVPAYREQGRIGAVVRGIREFCPDVVVVDDGSGDATAAEAEQAGAIVLRHGVNQGKGAALKTGFAFAREKGYEFLITMDADGQHAPADIPGFVETYRRTGVKAVVGNRMADAAGMPLVRRLTNRFMSWLLSRYIGQRVPDTQNGFRLYHCEIIPEHGEGCERFAAESEVLLRIGAAGIPIGSAPTQVIYGDEKSKINPLADTIRFFGMLRRWSREQRAKRSATP